MNLEEFGYQFGVNGAENLISKLNQIESETEQLDNAVQHLGNTFQQFFDLALRSAIPPAFIKMVMDQAMAFSKQAEYIDRLSQTSGISAKTIQQFGYALHRFGGDVSTATAQLDHLQSKLEQFRKPIHKGGGLASELAKLAKKYKVDLRGVNSSVDMLKALSVRMEKLSERKKLELARAFGLDDSTFLMVKNGLKSLEESLYKAQKFVLFDDKEIRQAKEFENTLRDIADNITLISKSFSFGAIPEMQKFANIMRKVTDFMTEHKQVVKGIGLTAFGAGAYGIFRLLNFLPTKFLKASAGVFGGGLALGSISEELDKLDRAKELDKLGKKKEANSLRNKTYIGRLERLGFQKTANYLELIYRSINDLAFNKSFEGLKNLSDKVGKDLGIEFLQKENINKSVDNANSIFGEYKDAFKLYGLTGLVARAMSSGDTVEKRLEEFEKNIEAINNEGGLFSFLWKELKTIFTELKNTLTSKDFWTPIFDKVDSLINYLKGLFQDLVIFVKQQAGIELSESDKAHLLKKQLMGPAQESANKAIKESSKEITDIINSDANFEDKKKLIQEKIKELSANIYKKHGNSGYSEESISAKLLFEGSKEAFNQKNPDIIKNVDSFTSYMKDLGLDLLASKEKITKLYEEYQKNKQQKVTDSSKALKATVDISDIVGDKKIDNVDLKNVSVRDFINKVFPLLSQDETGRALDRYRNILPGDSLLNSLTFAEHKSLSMEEFFNSLKGTDEKTGKGGGWFDKLLNPIEEIIKPLILYRLEEHQRTLIRLKKSDTDPASYVDYSLLDKNLDKLSFIELIQEEIKAEYNDFRRNWLSIDIAIEKLGPLFEESVKLIKSINEGIAKIRDKIYEYVEKFAGTAGAVTGASLGKIGGPWGMLLGALAGWLFGEKTAKNFKDENYSWGDYASEKLDKVKGFVSNLFSSKDKQTSIEDLKKQLASLQLQLYTSDTDVARDAVFDLIKKKEAEIAAAQAILDGKANLEAVGNQVAANSNSPAVNNNSQENVVNINQNINIGKTVSTADDVGIAAMNGARTGTDEGLRQATNNRVMGNIN